MKFYYNNELIRTSKTHEYKYALLSSSGKCVTCSTSKDRAESELTSRINSSNDKIHNYKNIIHAIETGATHYDHTYGRETLKVKLDAKNYDVHTLDGAKKYLENEEKHLEDLKTGWKVVELDARP